MAGEWGVPPWIITGEAPTMQVRLRWYLRGCVYVNARNKPRQKGANNSPSQWGPEWDD